MRASCSHPCGSSLARKLQLEEAKQALRLECVTPAKSRDLDSLFPGYARGSLLRGCREREHEGGELLRKVSPPKKTMPMPLPNVRRRSDHFASRRRCGRCHAQKDSGGHGHGSGAIGGYLLVPGSERLRTVRMRPPAVALSQASKRPVDSVEDRKERAWSRGSLPRSSGLIPIHLPRSASVPVAAVSSMSTATTSTPATSTPAAANHETIVDAIEVICRLAGISAERRNIPSVKKPNKKNGRVGLVQRQPFPPLLSLMSLSTSNSAAITWMTGRRRRLGRLPALHHFHQ